MMLRKCHQIKQKESANTSFDECRWENLEVARGSLLCMIKPNFILILLDHTLQWAKCELASCWCWWYASWEGFSTTRVNPERDLWSVLHTYTFLRVTSGFLWMYWWFELSGAVGSWIWLRIDIPTSSIYMYHGNKNLIKEWKAVILVMIWFYPDLKYLLVKLQSPTWREQGNSLQTRRYAAQIQINEHVHIVVFRVGNLIIRSKEMTKKMLEELALVFFLVMKIFPACFEKCVAFSFKKLWASPIFCFKQSSISLALGCTWGCPHIASHLERVVEAVSSNNPFALSSLFSWDLVETSLCSAKHINGHNNSTGNYKPSFANMNQHRHRQMQKSKKVSQARKLSLSHRKLLVNSGILL